MDKNKMLIDATHPEETRVVALRNGRVEEFDFESAARKLLRGNIYLAKVTRVEPSLQAAFIDYGGNRHGFLAFNEIHPDYYQIPVADREALKQEEARSERQAEEEADERARPRGGSRRRRRGRGERAPANAEPRGDASPLDAPHDDQPSDIETFEDGYRTSGPDDADVDTQGGHHAAAPLEHAARPDDVHVAEPQSLDYEGPSAYATPELSPGSSAAPGDHDHDNGRDHHHDHRHDLRGVDAADDEDDAADAGPDGNGSGEDDQVEQIATDEDALEELPERPRRRARQYKIQEVIKRRQIMLVQVVKEERGNKGAALTTYISLAGRYTVLMPNTARGGGISRKITQPQDRKRLKAIAEELDVEEGMGLIIRTAGAARTKQEIKRDYDYLMRLWESVRELTLNSTAPCLVYEEGNIIKRAIRDLYSKEFDQIVVAGEEAHREAQDFMEMLMPGAGSHVANYRAPEPLFARYGIERQLNALFSPYVTLRSGGYIVINQTEALVSVDVNSGKSTREFSIEETALNTNLEAAEEIARQLKLRDLAGLIVIDFIDMEEKRNNRKVEHRIKDALRFDRARIQVGRISHFGLLEMSRQRLRAGVLEGSTSQCPHCQGTGIIRSIESVSLAVLRGIEDHLLKQPSSIATFTTAEVALYILNHKRGFIVEMERRYGIAIRVESSDRMQGANFSVERIAAPVQQVKPAQRAAVSMDSGFERDEEAYEEPIEAAAVEPLDADDVEGPGQPREPRREGSEDERRGRRRRRRRGRRDGQGEGRPGAEHATALGAEGGSSLHASPADDQDDDADDEPDTGPAGDRVRSEHGDDLAAASADGDEPGDGHPGGPRAEADGESNGDSRRRGRRRGRRGGRSRRREGGDAPAGVDRHEWGIAETAVAGSGEPFYGEGSDTPVGLVGSVQGGYERSGEHALRPGIVETFSAADEAVRAAVILAGGTPAPRPAPRQAPNRPELEQGASIRPPVPAKPRPVHAAPAAPAPAMEVRSPAPVAPVGIPAAAQHAMAGPATILPPVPAWPRKPEADAPAERPAPVVRDATPTFAAAFRLAGDVGQTAAQTAATSMTNGVNGTSVHHDATQSTVSEPSVAHVPNPDEPARPSRKGWWQRRFGSAD